MDQQLLIFSSLFSCFPPHTAMALQSPPSTILIVNISNSTLIDCVIGNGTHTVAECQPLMQETERHMKGV